MNKICKNSMEYGSSYVSDTRHADRYLKIRFLFSCIYIFSVTDWSNPSETDKTTFTTMTTRISLLMRVYHTFIVFVVILKTRLSLPVPSTYGSNQPCESSRNSYHFHLPIDYHFQEILKSLCQTFHANDWILRWYTSCYRDTIFLFKWEWH